MLEIIEPDQKRRRSDWASMHDPILKSLEQYWQTLRRTQQIPARTDLQPTKIDQVLSYTFIVHRVAPGTARFRVAGQKIHELLKMDARGMPLTTLFHPQARGQIQDYVELAFAEPAIIALPLVSDGSLLRPTLNGTMLLLPMHDYYGQSNRLLGALVTDPQNSSNRPRRFVIPPDAPIRHDPLGLKLAATQLMPRDMIQTKRPDASRPALRLVVNND